VLAIVAEDAQRYELSIREATREPGRIGFNVLILNAWKTDGPWIPPGRLDLAGEYLEARLRGVTGSAQRDLLDAISVPTSDATLEQQELAQDIRASLGWALRL
jgi:hypothetical protein